MAIHLLLRRVIVCVHVCLIVPVPHVIVIHRNDVQLIWNAVLCKIFDPARGSLVFPRDEFQRRVAVLKLLQSSDARREVRERDLTWEELVANKKPNDGPALDERCERQLQRRPGMAPVCAKTYSVLEKSVVRSPKRCDAVLGWVKREQMNVAKDVRICMYGFRLARFVSPSVQNNTRLHI